MSALSLHAQERSNSTNTTTRYLLLMKHKHCASIRHECRDLKQSPSPQSTEETYSTTEAKAERDWPESDLRSRRVEKADFSAMCFHPDLSERITNDLEIVVR